MTLALLLVSAALGVAAPPTSATPTAPAEQVAWQGGPLEVQADGRVAPLGRPAELLPGDAAAGPAVVERADLIWGCRGDRARAQIFEGDARLGLGPRDACVARVDVRPPCAPDVDDAGLEVADARALQEAAAAQHQAAVATHRQRTAQLAAGYSEWGPGLRLLVSGGGVLWLRSSRLGLEACGCDGSSARALGDELIALRLPRLARPTVVWVRVPRYLGAVHRLGAKKPPTPAALSFLDPFHALDASLEEALEEPSAGAMAEAFSAPAGCDCAPCDPME